MSWQLRRATAADLDAIMLLETGIFGTDAWSAEQYALGAGEPARLLSRRRSDWTTRAWSATRGCSLRRERRRATSRPSPSRNLTARGGLGRTLIQALVAEARKRGASKVFLEVRADNGSAQHLYETLGFVAIAERIGYYQPDNVDAIVMQYDIPAPVTRPAVGA